MRKGLWLAVPLMLALMAGCEFLEQTVTVPLVDAQREPVLDEQGDPILVEISRGEALTDALADLSKTAGTAALEAAKAHPVGRAAVGIGEAIAGLVTVLGVGGGGVYVQQRRKRKRERAVADEAFEEQANMAHELAVDNTADRALAGALVAAIQKLRKDSEGVKESLAAAITEVVAETNISRAEFDAFVRGLKADAA